MSNDYTLTQDGDMVLMQHPWGDIDQFMVATREDAGCAAGAVLVKRSPGSLFGISERARRPS